MADELSSARELPAHVRRLLCESPSGQTPVMATGTLSAQLSQARLLEEELIDRSSAFPAGQLDEDPNATSTSSMSQR